MERTCEKVVECACIIVSLQLSQGDFKSIWILGLLVVVVKKTEMKRRWWLCETYGTMELALYIGEFLL